MKPLLLFLLPLFLMGCDDNQIVINDPEPIKLKAGMEKRVQQDNEFALDLFKQVIATSDEKNIFISPLSVSIALGMAWNGAGGDTKAEMASTLKMAELTPEQINEYYQILLNALPEVDNSTKLNIANSIWYRAGFPIKPTFLDVNRTYFNSEVRSLDFAKDGAVDIINNWCADKTNQLIKKPLDKISADAMLYLINAIYFKGIWSKQFDKKDTREANFTTEDKQTVKVNMMNQTDTFAYRQDETAQYLDMPYGNKSFSMTVILPNDGKTTADVLAALDRQKWNSVVESLSGGSKKVIVSFPRFKLEAKYELKEPLMNMGMIKAFDAMQADFSPISDIDLVISRILHSTFCEVDEVGTEAAAVTIIEFELTSMPVVPVFNANKPFVFVIRENSTGVILFMGKMGAVQKH
jgi:serine protease inhibitor